MKKILLLITVCCALGVNAQTKKVLFEEFTGAYCGTCHLGSHIMDSLLGLYPDVIGVSLHTYSFPDSMFFSEIDTLGIEYAPGAPLGATDRIFWGAPSWNFVAETQENWGARIQNRLALTPELTVSISANWNASTRNITTNISTDILTNMAVGDYRFNLYVVEDSVIGVGSGYDQSNLYNTLPGHQFFGLGDPILGYVHRHVVRAILPQAWGQAGIISTSPTAGQNFSTNINYTLPANYNENKIKLVAFVSSFTGNHQGDEVFNVAEITLPTSVGIMESSATNDFTIYPNPASTHLYLNTELNFTNINILDLTGKLIKTVQSKNNAIDVAELASGIYFIQLIGEDNIITQKFVKH